MILKQEIEHNRNKVTLSITDTKKYRLLNPKTQSYGFCFNNKGEIAIGSYDGKNWLLPGGTIETGETPKMTLIREVDEELCLELSKIKVIGIQKVIYPNNPNKREGELYYQIRYAAIIKKEKKMRPDHDKGKIWSKKFIRIEEFNKWLKWGKVGEHFAKAAKKQYLAWNSSKNMAKRKKY